MKLRFRADRMTPAFRKETRNASATIRPGSESHALSISPRKGEVRLRRALSKGIEKTILDDAQ